MNKPFVYGLLALAISTLACEPMIAIGKYEFLILVVLIVVLLGPPLYRLARRVEEFFKHQKKNE